MKELSTNKKATNLKKYIEDNAQFIIASKTLNIYGKTVLFFFYTFLVAGMTHTFYKSSKQSNNKEIGAIQAQQELILKKIKGLNNNNIAYMISEKNEQLRTKIVDDFMKQLSREQTIAKETIDKQKLTIFNLKKEIESISLLEQHKLDKVQTSEVIPYSNANLEKLRYQHQLKLKRLKEEHKKRENAFLVIYDLSDRINKKKWNDFRDQLKIEYNNKVIEYKEARTQFQKNKFRQNIASN